MTKTYHIQGMTCQGCVDKVEKALENIKEIKSAEVQLVPPQAKLTFSGSVPIHLLQESIGEYKIQEVSKEPVENKIDVQLPEKSLTTYKPLILIVVFIAGISLLAQYPFSNFSAMLWMRHFMAGFFIVFAFFKILNIEGFANSYQRYDIIAAKWKIWGRIYPFVELGLGILYLINVIPNIANVITIVVLGLSSIGVIKSVLDKRKIKCACLGDVFQLPMSTITIVEDLTMVSMAGIMLF